MLEKIKAYARLARLHSLGFTATVPVIGALCIGIEPTFKSFLTLLLLFLIGALIHIYGSSLNEYIDVEVDRRARVLSEKPLVKGEIKRENALLFSIASALLAVLIALVLKNILALSLLLISMALGTAYDVSGKRFAGTDLFLASWASLFFIFGAFTVSDTISELVLIVAGLAFFRTLFQNSVAGSIKDVEHDRDAKIKTFPVLFRVSIKGENIIYTNTFRAYAIGIEIIYAYLLSMPVLLSFIDRWSVRYEIWQTFLFMLFMAGMFLTLRFLFMKTYDREMLKRMCGAHELFAYPLILIMLMPFISIPAGIFLAFFPFAWALIFLFLLYRGSPDI